MKQELISSVIYQGCRMHQVSCFKRPLDTEFQEENHEDDGNGRWDSDDVDADSGPEC